MKRVVKCQICFFTGKGNVEAVAICNELKTPVCAGHRWYCIEEGHGTSPLETVEAE